MELFQIIILVFAFISGTFGSLNLPANDLSKENTLFRSTTSGKASSILREILNQESLVRFSMVQKIQSLVMDVIDSKNNTEILKKKLIQLAKQLDALKSKDQKLEQNNIRLKQELNTIYNRISDIQNLTLANIQSLNESEIYFLRTQLLDLQKENDELRLENSEIKEQMGVLREEDVSSLRNETLALKQQYDTLSKEKDALEDKLHQMEKGIRTTNIEARLKMMIENSFRNFTHSVAETLDDFLEDQNATKTQLLNVSSMLQPGCIFPFDCFDIYNKCGQAKSGVYEIYPFKTSVPTQVLCDMDLAGGGWTVIQHRHRDNPRVNFTTTWDEYKRGFGDVRGNYWLGNDAIHQLTTKFQSKLYIRMTSTSNQSYEVNYSSFSISTEADGYRLSLGTKSGSSADAFRGYNVVNQKFSTFDSDNYHKCAALCKSGWWFDFCTWTNLNAPFFEDHTDYVWYPLITSGKNLYQSDMLIGRK